MIVPGPPIPFLSSTSQNAKRCAEHAPRGIPVSITPVAKGYSFLSPRAAPRVRRGSRKEGFFHCLVLELYPGINESALVPPRYNYPPNASKPRFRPPKTRKTRRTRVSHFQKTISRCHMGPGHNRLCLCKKEPQNRCGSTTLNKQGDPVVALFVPWMWEFAQSAFRCSRKARSVTSLKYSSVQGVISRKAGSKAFSGWYF